MQAQVGCQRACLTAGRGRVRPVVVCVPVRPWPSASGLGWDAAMNCGAVEPSATHLLQVFCCHEPADGHPRHPQWLGACINQQSRQLHGILPGSCDGIERRGMRTQANDGWMRLV